MLPNQILKIKEIEQQFVLKIAQYRSINVLNDKDKFYMFHE